MKPIKAIFRSSGLLFDVLVTDRRIRFGEVEYLIQPVERSGDKWYSIWVSSTDIFNRIQCAKDELRLLNHN